MKQLLDYIIPNIVDHPESVVITENDTPSGLIISIQVDPADMGRVIGKAGKVIKAIRQIARVISIRKGIKVHIDVVDQEGQGQPYQENQSSTEPSELPAEDVS